MNTKIIEFWNKAHTENNRTWLSGSDLEGVWGALNILNRLIPGITILNIGVGLGDETISLSQKNVIVDVLDISQVALERVKDKTRHQYLSSNIYQLPINEYDIAVSHLVTQHMNDEDLNEQVKFVLRSLKPNGIFAMQFAFVNDNDVVPQGEISQMHGGVIRKLSEIEKIVINNNGYLSWISDVTKWAHTPARWQYVHIKQNQ